MKQEGSVRMSNQPFPERRRSWNAGLREHFRELEEKWNRTHPPLAVVHLPANLPAGLEPPDLATPGHTVECLRILETKRPNLLVIGSPTTVAPVVQIIERSLIRPVVSCRAGRLALQRSAIGTLVIHDADRLGREEQNQLHSWVNQHAEKQLVTTASESLFSLVARNMFSDTLFYRLNAMSLIVEEASAEIV